jgi:hypothetical protein
MSQQRYVIGLDLGQANDPSAVAIIEHTYHARGPSYRVRALHRYRLGTSYTAIVDDLTTRMLTAPLARASMLAIDATGVGRPVVDLFKDNRGLRDVYAITITAGTAVSGGGYATPYQSATSSPRPRSSFNNSGSRSPPSSPTPPRYSTNFAATGSRPQTAATSASNLRAAATTTTSCSPSASPSGSPSATPRSSRPFMSPADGSRPPKTASSQTGSEAR